MKIIIQPEVKNKYTSEIEDNEVSLDDSGFDVSGFLELAIGTETTAAIHVNDLYPAVIAFKERYERESRL